MPAPPDSTNDTTDLPSQTPGDERETNRRVVWVLVVMTALAIFVWPTVLGAEVPAGTVAALLTAITTIIIARGVRA